MPRVEPIRPPSAGVREGRRQTRRLLQRRKRARRRLERGQTLVIFALSFTVLVALVGLSIDAARAVELFARGRRTPAHCPA
jgi:Putative Flp pilus-assembly TadE/G-like